MQLLSQKTVIYATHQLEFLDAADLVLVRNPELQSDIQTYQEFSHLKLRYPLLLNVYL
jgi:ABC-type transport system involved in cytochrome bd biosynthesis fused ATPase/permease subunit